MWGCIGIGRSAVFTKVTSGASATDMSIFVTRWGWRGALGVYTDWICVSELEFQAESLIQINRIGIEDLDIHKPLCEAIRSD